MHNSVIDVHSIYDDICTVTKVNPFYMGPCNYIYDAFNIWMYVAFVITCCLVSQQTTFATLAADMSANVAGHVA